MNYKSLLVAGLVAVTAGFGGGARADDGLGYLSAYDPLALRMLTCADLLSKDGSRISGIAKKDVALLSASYRKAGRAAVVRASLKAPEKTGAAKIDVINFTSKVAHNVVTGDLRAHEQRAGELTEDLRASGFDVTSSCVDGPFLAEAAKLNEWFAQDTSVLTSVK